MNKIERVLRRARHCRRFEESALHARQRVQRGGLNRGELMSTHMLIGVLYVLIGLLYLYANSAS